MMPVHNADLERNVVHFALYSRLAILLLQFISNTLVPDHENDAFVSPFAEIPQTALDTAVNWFLGGLLRWDAQHHLHISIYGYVYEHSLAFFPGFAFCIRLISTLAEFVLFPLNVVSIHLIAAVLFNLVCFALAAKTLYKLSCKVLKDEYLAYLACTLFCINPASVFFTAPYSEAFFSYISFSAMLCDEGWTKYALISLSTIIRSNGVTNIGFSIYNQLRRLAELPKCLIHFISFILNIVIIIVSTLSLFFFYQMYSYVKFCVNYDGIYTAEVINMAFTKSYVLAGYGTSGMCNQTSIFPYFYIQNHYWNVGFLEYFHFKQLPNFALAFPIIYFVLVTCTAYFKHHPYLILSMRLDRNYRYTKSAALFEYIIHLCGLLVICLFFVHIQVTTRLLCSSSPALYWLLAMLIHSKEKKTVFNIGDLSNLTTTSSMIFFYFLLYFVLGTILFSNNFPWT